MRASKLLVALGLLSLGACGSADNGAGPAPAPSDTGTPSDGDAGPPATCSAKGGADAPDDKGVDENCDGADGVVGVDVYVSATGADTNAGTPDQPLRTIATALGVASSRGGKVLVASGSYSMDAIKAPGTWSVFGGYASNYIGAPKRASTVLAGGAGGVRIENAQSARLAHLTVRGIAASDDMHPAAIALVSSVTKLALDDVVLEAGDARDGTPGADGAAGDQGTQGGNADTPTSLTCKGFVQPTFSFGATKYMPNAEGKPAGDFSAARTASTGSDGAAGTDGADASGTPTLTSGVILADRGSAGASNGRPGYGGAGGGGGTSDRQYIGGAGGSGGCAGIGGEGGASGGAAIALLVLRGDVSITRSSFHTGAGGAGGDGGNGGAGGPGGLPGLPTAVPSLSPPATCTPASDPARANCAEYGGTGGKGGAGGHGGGGAGGWTIAIATAPTTNAQVDDASTFDLGRPGNGGTGNGGGRAPNGRSVRSYAAP